MRKRKEASKRRNATKSVGGGDSAGEQSDFETSFAVFPPIDLAPPCALAEQGITLPSPDYSLQLARETPTPSEVDYCLRSDTVGHTLRSDTGTHVEI